MNRILFSVTAILILIGLQTPPARQTPKLGLGRKYSTIERIQIDRLSALHKQRLAYQSQRHEVGLKTGYTDYRGILHAHAEDSSHTGGTRPELLAAAKRAGVSFIMLSDHVRPTRDFIDDSWRGLHEGVLFIPGAESEGFLVYPQRSIKNQTFTSRDQYIALLRRVGGNIFLSHVEERFDWPTNELDGLEIYNHHTDIKDEGPFLQWLGGAAADPARLTQLQYALSEFPTEFFGAAQDYLGAIIEKWDRDLVTHRLTGVAANDCHHNQGFIVRVGSDDSIEVSELVGTDKPRRITVSQASRVRELIQTRKVGEVIARIDIDPYDRSLNFVTTHILARTLSEGSVREALRQSRAYVAHDWLADPTGFAFVARTSNRNLAVMGDELDYTSGLALHVEAPVPARIKVFRDGKVVREIDGDRLRAEVESPGVYRVELWLTLDGEERPWIYSNAIRVRPKR